MRNLAPLLLVILCGCGSSTRKCKSHTLFVRLNFDAGSAGADTLDVTLTLDGNTEHPSPVMRSGSGNSVEIDFDSYPEGKTLDVTINALASGTVIGMGMKSIPLVAGCTADTINITSVIGEDLSMNSFDLSMSREDMSSRSDMPSVEMSVDMAPSNSDMANCDILYVAPGGDNLQDGCQPSRPLASIKTAITRATAAQEVHVCAGTYSETSLSVAGVVKGGYSCTTWGRTATFGYPNFDSTNASIIQNANYALSTATVTIASPSPSPVPIVLDGFTIEGSATGSNGSTALLVTGDATISNNKIVGGGTSSTTIGSIGLEADGNDEVFNNSINGGSGTSTSTSTQYYGSVGIYHDSSGLGVPHLHGNTVNGGSGNGGAHSVGSSAIDLIGGSFSAAAGKAVENNLINGGTGQTTISGYPGSTWAVRAAVQDLDFIANQLDGGAPASNSTLGLYPSVSGTVNILRNRIFRGVGNGGLALQVVGGTAVIEDNMIHSGQSTTAGSDALWLQGDGYKIIHNTIVAGITSGGAPNNGVHLSGTNSNIVIENNILVASGGTCYGVNSDNANTISSLKNNVSFFTTILRYNSTEYTNDQTMEGALSFASGNVNLQSSCTGDTGCIAVSGCTSATGCLSTIFGSWNGASNGETDLFSTGWLLTSTVPCSVSKSSLDDSSTVTVDLFNTTRTSNPSMGAYEYDGTCQ